VIKTTVYLSEDQKRGLARVAKRLGRPEAELIREALDRLITAEPVPKPTLPLFRSGDPTLAERVDEALADFGS
jgi:hypothetical protein